MDEAALGRLALDLVQGRSLPLTGIVSSVGVLNPPWAVYFLALPLLLTPSFQLVVASVAGLHLAAVGLTFVMTRRYFGAVAGLVAAAIMAVSFWPVTHGRFVWPQNLMPPLATVVGFSIFLVAVEGRRWAWPVAVAAGLLLTQVHYAGLAYLPLLAVVLVWRARRIGPAPIIVSGLLGLLILAPFGLWLAQQGTRGSEALLGGRLGWGLDPFLASSAMVAARGYEDWLGLAAPPALHRLVRGSSALLEGFYLAALPYLALRGLAGRKRQQAAARGLLALWLWAVLLAFVPHLSPVRHHYFLALYPAPFIALGVVASDSLDAARRSRRARVLALVPLLLLAALPPQAALQLWSLRLWENGPLPARGLPLGYMEQAAGIAAGAAAEAGSEYVQLSGLSHQALPLETLVRARHPAVSFPNRDTLVSPAQAPAVMTAVGNGGAVNEFLAAHLEGTRLPLALAPWGEDAIRAYRVSRRDLVGALTALEGYQALDAGIGPVRLHGVGVPQPLEKGRSHGIPLLWSVQERPPGRDLRFFVHLVGGDGTPLVQDDALGLDPALWRVGDWVLGFYRLEVPASLPDGQYALRIGLYAVQTLERYPVVGRSDLAPVLGGEDFVELRGVEVR